MLHVALHEHACEIRDKGIENKGIQAGFALSIAIVAKCDKNINVAQDFFIWRKCMATTFCQVT